MKEPRYKTLAELVSAIKDGSIDVKEQDLSLTIDNDSCYMYGNDEVDDDTLFDGGMPGELLTQALELLGVPWQNA